jgi:hypothetical protein
MILLRSRRPILRRVICYIILLIKSTATANLLSEFEALPVEENQEFVREVINHLPPRDSGHSAMTCLLPPVMI